MAEIRNAGNPHTVEDGGGTNVFVETLGDEVLDTFMNGQYTYAIEQMVEFEITPDELAQWLVNKATERQGKYYNLADEYNGFFDVVVFAQIGYDYRKKLENNL